MASDAAAAGKGTVLTLPEFELMERRKILSKVIEYRRKHVQPRGSAVAADVGAAATAEPTAAVNQVLDEPFLCQQLPAESGHNNSLTVAVVHPKPEANGPVLAATAHVCVPSCGVLVEQIKRIGGLVDDFISAIVGHCTPANQIEEHRKRCATYSQKALMFAITTFAAYLGSASASTGNTAFKVAIAAFFVAVLADLTSVTRTPKWGSFLVYLSWFLLVLVSYLLLVSFNKDYSYAIIPVPLPIIVALLQHKLRPGVRQQSNTDIESAGEALNTKHKADQDVHTEAEAAQDLDRIFDLAAGIVNCGGLVSMLLGHYLVGPNQHIAVSAIWFFFFFTVVLGLYLMMITTVRPVALTLHARHLTVLLKVLLVITLITILIHGVPSSGNDSHA
ncbi:uncharacterized protein LOC133898308 [Phragmites australis]|uniref:uncharacterized protein LOC133898308 n=1 Tax=Phragmites australis TaxID=29695 RepID=UPI002D76CBAC|nr:uncharacterized protein LOC133898308 [Phragmites australis]